jgi:hypothetical protein
LQPADESLNEEFVRRLLFRLWTGGKAA